MHSAIAIIATILVLAPPSGRPPVGPLQRVDPKMYDLTYTVTVSTDVPYGQDDPRLKRGKKDERPTVPFGVHFSLKDSPIVMPVVLRGTYSHIAHETIGGHLWVGQRASPRQHFRLDAGLPYNAHLAVLPIESFSGNTFRWQIGYRVTSFASRLDEPAAMRLAWPREWPEEVRDGLAPQLYIESDAQIFADTVARVTEGQLRFVPPYLAAKDLVRYAITNVQTSGDFDLRGRLRVLHGLEVSGAVATATSGRGSPNDLVCVCVALLRAAGIPARPVIGVTDVEDGGHGYKTWAEFYLHGAGWVPFDPDKMRGQAIQNRDLRQPWSGFGKLDDLNDWIPLAYHFIPPRAVQSPYAPAVWGWDPRPSGPPRAEQRIEIGIVSRGRGVEDPG